MTLTKALIVEHLFAKNIFTLTQSGRIIETLLELIKESLQNGEDVLLTGFGKFSVKEKDQRKGRNLRTGKPINLPSRKVVTFKCSDILKARINGAADLGMPDSKPVSPEENQPFRRQANSG